MLPILIAIGPFKVYTIAVCFVAAFILFWFMVWKKGRDLHFDEMELFDATIMILLGGIITSRLTYVFLVNFKDFGFNVLSYMSLLSRPGMWELGFVLGAGLVAIYQAKKRKWDIWSLTDTLVTAYVLYQAVMALGAFVNGSGYGIVANNFLGLRFHGQLDKHVPVQLYEMIGYGFLFWFLTWVEGKYRTYGWYKGTRSEALSGFITAIYFIVLGSLGLILTIIKQPQTVWWGVRWDYLIELIYLSAGLMILYSRSGSRGNKGRTTWATRPVMESKTSNRPLVKESTDKWSQDIFN